MSQYKANVNVTKNSATVEIPGVDARPDIDAGDEFMTEFDKYLAAYYVSAEPTYAGGNTYVALTAPYQGDDGSGVAARFQGDYDELGIVRMGNGDRGTHGTFNRSMGKIRDAILQRDAEMVAAVGNLAAPLCAIPLAVSLAMSAGVGSVTFSRPGPATYVDPYGVVQKVGNDVPRFEKNGLLIEGASANLLIYVEQFGNVAWGKSNSTITADAATAPDGTTTADKLVEAATTSSHYITQAPTLSAATVYTASVYAKAAERTVLRFGQTTDGITADFDLSLGIVGNLIGSPTSATIESLPNGWYRLKITWTQSGGGPKSAGLMLVSGGTNNYTGDGSSGLYIWGVQMEPLPFASSYIPTVAAGVARAADICTLTLAGNWPDKLIGHSCTIDFDVIGFSSGSSQEIIRIDSTHYEILRAVASGVPGLDYYNSPSGLLGTTALAARTVYRAGFVFDGDTNVATTYLDGVQERSGTLSPTNQHLATVVNLGGQGGSYHLFGHIKNLRIYDRALSATEMRIA